MPCANLRLLFFATLAVLALGARPTHAAGATASHRVLVRGLPDDPDVNPESSLPPAEEIDEAGNLIRKEEPPTIGPTHGGLDEDGYYAIFREFHEMDQKRRTAAGQRPSAESWEALGERCAVHCRVGNPIALEKVGPFLLRLRLLEGQCFLFASIERCWAGQSGEHLEDYERGIRILELLYRVNPDDIGPIPEPRNPENNVYRFNTGVTKWDPGGDKWWLSAREMSDYLLSEFCPWGVEAYFVLARAGLTRNFDWYILRPYGRDGVPDASKLIVLDPASVPLHVKQDAQAIARGNFMFVDGPRVIKWKGAPRVTHSIAYLSREAYGIKTSTQIDLGWKAFKVVTAGPLEVIGDIAQDYAVELLGEMFSDATGVYAEIYNAINLAHEADNWGFDKSWLLEGKVEFKEAKFAKVLLVKLLRMEEEKLLDNLFAGMAPEYKDLQANSGDARTYDRGGMPHVILRTDVHGVEAVAEDEYPRISDIVRFYQFSPSGLSDAGDRCNLWDKPLGNATRGEEYLRGETGPQLKTWLPVPTAPKPWGFRRYVTDFTPRGQGVRLKFPADALKNLRDDLKDNEELVALIKCADGTLVKDSAQPVSGAEVSWLIHDMRMRPHLVAWPGKTPLDGTPEPGPMLGGRGLGRNCFVHRIRTRYVIEALKCERINVNPEEYKWQAPRAKVAEIPLLFYGEGQAPTGVLTRPEEGAVELTLDYKGPAPEPKKEAPAYPFTICGVKVSIAGEFKSDLGTSQTRRDFGFRSEGAFSGGEFEGKYELKTERPKENRTETGKARVSLKPPKRGADGKMQMSDAVTGFSITYDVKHHLDDLDGRPYDGSIHAEISGAGLKLNENSTLLTAVAPQGRGADFLEPGERGDLLRRRNPWLSVAYFTPEDLQGVNVNYIKEDHNPTHDPPLHKIERLTRLDGCTVEIYFQWHVK